MHYSTYLYLEGLLLTSLEITQDSRACQEHNLANIVFTVHFASVTDWTFILPKHSC